MDIYDEMKAAGVEIQSHESDLYVPVNDTTRQIVAKHPELTGIRTFIHKKETWYDIPFQYTPWWEEKQKLAAKKGTGV